VLDPVVIGQDDQTELHVQAVIQGGRRHLDIRVWRRGPTGFAPSRNALTLDAAELDALQDGIAELLEASNGGRQVARVVWDKDEGRRLRAETEPFGTRFVARLGFWHRVRDSWKPASEGLLLSADRLVPLQALLRDIRPRLEPDPEPEAPPDPEIEQEEDARQSWPVPGADWITLQPGRVALHPRGTRITADVEEDEQGAHCVAFHQWKREDHLWLTQDAGVRLGLAELDQLLEAVRVLAESEAAEGAPEQHLPLDSGATLWIRTAVGDAGSELRLEVLPPTESDSDADLDQHLQLPSEYLLRFGRMLWQIRMALIARLSKDEREAALSTEEQAEVVGTVPPAETENVPEGDLPETSSAPDAALAPERVVLEEATMIAWKPEPPPAPPTAVASPPPAPPTTLAPPPPDAPWAVSMGDVKLGHFHVFFFLPETEPRTLTMQWEGRSLQLPVEHLGEMMARVRDLYYDTLRGRRGRAVTIGTRPAVTLSVHHHGATNYLALDQEIEGKVTHLAFPTQQVPAFLNVAEAALAKI
jgi:hypothetical protein